VRAVLIEREELCALIPHDGAMCLLDGVEAWDESRIRCLSRSHLRADNPLRRGGVLAAVHGVEYGAQAMAVHGGLLARARGESLGQGFLAAIREVSLNVPHLDDIEVPLQVDAERLMGEGGNLMYGFELSAADRVLAAGRLMVVAREAA
jgi:predicted hotdog family 3-hydroxylacyl-ACP dehydratase